MSEKLQISKIKLDGGTQARARLDESTVIKYRKLVEESQEAGLETGKTIWPFTDPVEVYYDGTDYYMADGFHRTEACLQAGRYVVEAHIRQGTRRDAVLFAAGANADHGLPRSDEDKRRAVRRLLEDDEWGRWSDREIARRCKVSHPFVKKIRDEVQPDTGNVSSIERTFVHPKTGRETVMNTANIGKTAVTPKQMREEAIPFQTESGHTVVLNPSPFAAIKTLRDRGYTVEHVSPTNPGAPHDELSVWKVDGREPINKMELWELVDNPIDEIDAIHIHKTDIAEMLAPPASATAVSTAVYWLKNYVDPVHNRTWPDLDDNQVHHANSPCFQAFKAQHPDIINHKEVLKEALANLKREKALAIAESIKSLWDATLRLIAQSSNRELTFQLNIAATKLYTAYETAVNEGNHV